ncbi:hypothetical protein SM39_2639 [Serratia marcescens SM39]|uniref:Uncharacterized protein n=1 Tax=Serratia marcescens SM39 TaxID=1334564 RepID=A0AAT9E6R0_SERMA|nr:hypothetical protein SM39_2639 [Serratia marcescens SM39]
MSKNCAHTIFAHPQIIIKINKLARLKCIYSLSTYSPYPVIWQMALLSTFF